MNKAETMELMADMLKQSRHDAGKSQQYMADALSVSKKTVQNWEMGLSSPPINLVYDWFNVLCTPPQPYILNILYPDISKNKVYEEDSDFNKALIQMIEQLPTHLKRKLYFILEGKHGSSPAAIIDMTVANLQCTLKDRLTICQSIITTYEISEKLGLLHDTDDVTPNVSSLKSTFEKAIIAVAKRLNSYLNS